MIVATNTELRSLFGESLHSSGLVSSLGSVHGRSGSIIENTTWALPAGPSQLDGRRIDDTVKGPSRPSGPRPPLAEGDRLGGFRLLERLGRGGQGDVWKALRREPIVEVVAIKILKPSLARDPDRMAQFRREAERGIRLTGPSLLPVYELNAINGYHFMVMPYVEGITLREIIKARGAHRRGMPTEEFHRLAGVDDADYLPSMTRALAQATRALAQAHAQQIAHRDIKPANILLDNRRPPAVFLCDFGLGRDLEIATRQQMRDGAGTPMYMAPERLLRATADEIKCDIYSMGVTIFEALTLARPFEVPEHITLSSLPAFLAGSRPKRPGEVEPGFPEDVEAVILKAMDRDPDRRHGSADELAADLERVGLRWTFRCGRLPLDGPHRPPARRPHAPAPRPSRPTACPWSVDEDPTRRSAAGLGA